MAELRALRREQIPPNATAYTVIQAGVLLGCEKSTIFALLAEGRLKPAGRVGKLRMITAESVQHVLDGEPERARPARKPKRSAVGDLAGLKAELRRNVQSGGRALGQVDAQKVP